MKTIVRVWYPTVIRPQLDETLLGVVSTACYGQPLGKPTTDASGPHELHTVEEHEFARFDRVGEFVQRSSVVIKDRCLDKGTEAKLCFHIEHVHV